MGMMSKQILSLLFSGTGEIGTAVPLLVIVCTAVPASCLISAISAVLQAYGYAWIPMVSTAIGCAVKAASLYVLCAEPRIGILAAPVSTLLCCTVTVCANLIFVAKYTPDFGFTKQLYRSVASTAIAVGAAAVLQRMLQVRFESVFINVIVPIAVAVVTYIPIALKSGLIRISDIQSILKK
jgi:O-antigen/teichoic acid export membrane protein